jgi:hypothetical protein
MSVRPFETAFACAGVITGEICRDAQEGHKSTAKIWFEAFRLRLARARVSSGITEMTEFACPESLQASGAYIEPRRMDIPTKQS